MTYGQFCPVALGAEIVAERWTPLIVRELLSGARRFSDVQQGVPKMSRNLLTQRLASLQHSGVIEKKPAAQGRGFEYHLTPAGRELADVIEAIGVWGYRWASKDLTREQLDPDFIMWALRRMIRREALPDERVVVHVRFRRDAQHRYWLLLERPEPDVCVHDPGYEVHVEMVAEAEALARVCLGQVPIAGAMRDGRIEVSGAPRWRRGLTDWLGHTHFAESAAR